MYSDHHGSNGNFRSVQSRHRTTVGSRRETFGQESRTRNPSVSRAHPESYGLSSVGERTNPTSTLHLNSGGFGMEEISRQKSNALFSVAEQMYLASMLNLKSGGSGMEEISRQKSNALFSVGEQMNLASMLNFKSGGSGMEEMSRQKSNALFSVGEQMNLASMLNLKSGGSGMEEISRQKSNVLFSEGEQMNMASMLNLKSGGSGMEEMSRQKSNVLFSEGEQMNLASMLNLNSGAVEMPKNNQDNKKMLSNQYSLNADLGPLHLLYGTTMRNGRESFEQEMKDQNSSVSRPQSNGPSSVGGAINPMSMLNMNSGGFGMTQNVSQISPLCPPRPILGCKEWNFPSTNPCQHHPGYLLNLSSDSEGSAFSGVDICDLISSLSLSPPKRCSPSKDQELEKLKALYNVSSSSVFNTESPSLSFSSNRPLTASDNIEHYNRAVQLNRSHPTCPGRTTISWCGELPRKSALDPTYSCKVFLGGIPWDVTEEGLVAFFVHIGRIRIEWPGKENSVVQPKGYAYVVFETEIQVKALLSCCARELSGGTNENYYLKIYSKKMKFKPVQVIPWRLMDSNYVVANSEKLDPFATVFVGGLHGVVSAEGLYKIMDDLFGGVSYVGIDTDKFKYPIGSARVTFNNRFSYIKAIKAEFVEIKTSRFTKTVQVDPYLEEAVCSVCLNQTGPYFCRELSCFRYYCAKCWAVQHQSWLMDGHTPLVRTSKYQSNMCSLSHPRCMPH